MDAQLERQLAFDGGFFVEAGANDGYAQSNTYRLERVRGWRGVLIEPVPALYHEARIERESSQVFNCALVSKDHDGSPVRLIYGGMMTTVCGTRDSEVADRAWVEAAHALAQEEPEHEFIVPGRTLSAILDEIDAPEVDLLSLDVEGFEPQVLGGLEFGRHAPRWVLVEIREGGSRREEIEAILGERYVKVEQLSPYDVLYRRCA
jgi:FkbM family methyltransferase